MVRPSKSCGRVKWGYSSSPAKAPGEKLSSDATIMIGSTRQEFTKFVIAEAVRLKKVVADTGLKLEE